MWWHVHPWVGLKLAIFMSFVCFTGTLAVLNLGYAPVVGDRFKIITFDQRLAGSEFANLTWSGFAPGVGFTATYNAHDVTLNVTAVPEPGAWAWA